MNDESPRDVFTLDCPCLVVQTFCLPLSARRPCLVGFILLLMLTAVGTSAVTWIIFVLRLLSQFQDV